jgi:hypothetical protein
MTSLERGISLVAAFALLAGEARAETLIEDNVESGLVLAYEADADAVRRRLPADLELRPPPAGAIGGANVFVVAYDRQLQQAAAGRITDQSSLRFVAILAPVRARSTGKNGFAVLRSFDAHPALVPGPYEVSVAATIVRQTAVEAKGTEPRGVKDRWEVKTRGGDSIRLRLEYSSAVPERRYRDFPVHSAAKPELVRSYRIEELMTVVRSVAADVDRATKLEHHVRIRDMADIFTGETRLVAVIAYPVILRKVSVWEQQAGLVR